MTVWHVTIALQCNLQGQPNVGAAQPAWYAQPLLTAGATLLAALIGIGLALYKMKRDHIDAMRRERLAVRRSRLDEQVSAFYAPLVAILDANTAVFLAFGPPSRSLAFAEDNDQAGGAIWNYMIERVVTPNHTRLLDILLTKNSLLSNTDTFNSYTDLLLHILSYSAFRHSPSVLHARFVYPVQAREDAESKLNELRAELVKLDDQA